MLLVLVLLALQLALLLVELYLALLLLGLAGLNLGQAGVGLLFGFALDLQALLLAFNHFVVFEHFGLELGFLQDGVGGRLGILSGHSQGNAHAQGESNDCNNYVNYNIHLN